MGGAAAEGVKAVLGPGTGLGEAFLVWTNPAHGNNKGGGYYKVCPSEGGMSDFLARTQEEWDLKQWVLTEDESVRARQSLRAEREKAKE